jgi:hypothetical protein
LNLIFSSAGLDFSLEFFAVTVFKYSSEPLQSLECQDLRILAARAQCEMLPCQASAVMIAKEPAVDVEDDD